MNSDTQNGLIFLEVISVFQTGNWFQEATTVFDKCRRRTTNDDFLSVVLFNDKTNFSNARDEGSCLDLNKKSLIAIGV